MPSSDKCVCCCHTYINNCFLNGTFIILYNNVILRKFFEIKQKIKMGSVLDWSYKIKFPLIIILHNRTRNLMIR